MAAPHPEQVAAGCQGKVAFMTKAGAFVHLHRVTRRRNLRRTPGEHLTIYRCDCCHRFHLGRSFK